METLMVLKIVRPVEWGSRCGRVDVALGQKA